MALSIFQDGKVKPGVYKIQNLHTENYLDVRLPSMELCCRPATDLEEKRGLWKIRRFGDGYTIWMADPGNPSHFCSPMKGLGDKEPVGLTMYPVGWRIQRADNKLYQGFEYVRFHFGSTERTWDLWGGHKENGSPVQFCGIHQGAWQIWRLILVEAEATDAPLESETFGLGIPPYDGNESGKTLTGAQQVGSERDDFGVVVTEITTVTTRKKYRVDEEPSRREVPPTTRTPSEQRQVPPTTRTPPGPTGIRPPILPPTRLLGALGI